MSSEWKLDSKTTALLLIDLQNAVLGYETKPYGTSEVLERSRAMAEAFRAKGALVVYMRVPLNEVLSLPTDEAMNLPKDIRAVASEIADAAVMQGGDLQIGKHHWGAFAKRLVIQLGCGSAQQYQVPSPIRRSELPRSFEKISLHHVLTGENLSELAVKQAIELSDSKYCSVAASLRPSARVDVTFEVLQVQQAPAT